MSDQTIKWICIAVAFVAAIVWLIRRDKLDHEMDEKDKDRG